MPFRKRNAGNWTQRSTSSMRCIRRTRSTSAALRTSTNHSRHGKQHLMTRCPHCKPKSTCSRSRSCPKARSSARHVTCIRAGWSCRMTRSAGSWRRSRRTSSLARGKWRSICITRRQYRGRAITGAGQGVPEGETVMTKKAPPFLYIMTKGRRNVRDSSRRSTGSAPGNRLAAPRARS